MDPAHLESTMIHLIGPPGVGKFTIAWEIVRLTDARLVDNHALNNVIFNLIHVDGVTPLPAGVWPQIGKVREAVLDTLMHVSPPELSFVFTNYMRGEDAAEEAAFQQFVAVADIRGSTYVPVLLSCDTDELVRRIVSRSRQERMKLTDPVEGARMNDDVPHFRSGHPNVLELDVTRLPAERSARLIVEWARRRKQIETPRR
jgi:hypothetical protein